MKCPRVGPRIKWWAMAPQTKMVGHCPQIEMVGQCVTMVSMVKAGWVGGNQESRSVHIT